MEPRDSPRLSGRRMKKKSQGQSGGNVQKSKGLKLSKKPTGHQSNDLAKSLFHRRAQGNVPRGIDTDSVPTRSSSLPHLDTSLREPHSAPAAHSPTVPGAPTEEMSAGSSTHTQESMHLSETRRVLVELIERANSCVGYIDFSDNNVQPLLADAKDLLGRVVEQLEAGVRLSRDRDSKRMSMDAASVLAQVTLQDLHQPSGLDGELQNSRFIKKIDTDIPTTVTEDYSSPRLGARRLTPVHSSSELSSRASQAAAAAAATRSFGGHKQQQQVEEKETMFDFDDPTLSPKRQNEKLINTAGALVLASTDINEYIPGGADDRSEDKPQYLKKINVLGGGVTTDYQSPSLRNRRLTPTSTPKRKPQQNPSSRAGASEYQTLLAATIAQHDSAAGSQSPPASPKEFYSHMKLQNLALMDIEASRDAQERDRQALDDTPKPSYLKRIEFPQKQEAGEPGVSVAQTQPVPSKSDITERQELESLTEKLNAVLQNVHTMDSKTFVRCSVLLQLAVEKLEEAANK